MKIELFLKNINQETIGLEKPEQTKRVKREFVLEARKPEINRLCNGCIYASWTKDCCILDFSYKGLKSKEIETIPDYWMMRGEVDGGLLWNPETGSVYLLDKEGYNVLSKLESGLSEQEIAKDTGYSAEEMKAFIKEVLAIKLEK